MEEKSKQQTVFEWLLKHQDVLHSPDNASLYAQFKNSGLSRNRLRSYKSRLKEKIEAGEFEEQQDMEKESPEEAVLDRFDFSVLKPLLKGALAVFSLLVIYRIIKKLLT